MDSVQQRQFADALNSLGQNFEQFKLVHQKAQKDRDILLEEAKQKLADEITAKHEEMMKMLSAESARWQRPAGGDSPEVANEAREAEIFAKHCKSIQIEHQKTVASRIGGEPKWEPDVAQYKRYRKAFLRYLQVGEGTNLSMLGADEQKDMFAGIDPDGGYFVTPPTIAEQVEKRIFETSPMWEEAAVQTIGTREYAMPEDFSDIGVGWVAERAPRPTTSTITPSKKLIPAHEEYAEPAVSQQLFEDALFDIETYLADKLTDKFTRNENTAFVAGTGVGQPKGFLSYPLTVITDGSTFSGWNQLEGVNSGTSGEFAYSTLTQLVTSLKDAFQSNAKFYVKRQSVYKILNLTDNNGRLIFQPLLSGNLNNTPLMGYPIRYATDMPAATAGANVMAFGDMRAAYQIVKRIGMSMLRDPYTAKPNVLLYTRRRVGGDMKNFDALKIYTLQ